MRRELLVLLTTDPPRLVERSIELQRVLHTLVGDGLAINYQRGSFAQFIVPSLLCAEHFQQLLVDKGQNDVEVSNSESEIQTAENCHDCHLQMA
ncbi:MAG: hypothetical protein WDZ93_02285 [Candidatus Paceibacterota bacterium]